MDEKFEVKLEGFVLDYVRQISKRVVSLNLSKVPSSRLELGIKAMIVHQVHKMLTDVVQTRSISMSQLRRINDTVRRLSA
jgi:hypothetical protein